MLLQNWVQEGWLDSVFELENQKLIAKGGKSAAIRPTQPGDLACFKGWNYFKANFDVKWEGGKSA